MEHPSRQPTEANRRLARFFGWWQRNGRSVLVVFAGAEAFEAVPHVRQPIEQPPASRPTPEVELEVRRRREDFNRLGRLMDSYRTAREQIVAERTAGIIPAGVPDDISAIAPLPGGVEGQVGAMRDWLEGIEPRDFGEPPSGATVG